MFSILRITIFILLFSFLSVSSFADFIIYATSNALKIESSHYIVIHYHDFTLRRHDELFCINTYGQNAFFNDSINTFSYLILIDKLSKDTIWKKPCPALTHLSISKDEQYITGFSKIKIHNPIQFVVFDNKGKVIYYEGFSPFNYTLSDKELAAFAKQFPIYFTEIIANNGIHKNTDESWSVYPFVISSANINRIKSYFFTNFTSNRNKALKNTSETVANYFYWYNEAEPNIQFNEQQGILKSISFRDISNETCQINLPESNFDIAYFVHNQYITADVVSQYLKTKVNYPAANTDLNLPYLQMGILSEYYAELPTFLKNCKLVFIHDASFCDAYKVEFYELTIFNSKDENLARFSIKNNQVSSEIINTIQHLKDVKSIYLENIKISLTTHGKTVIRTLMDFKYTIL